LRCLVGTPEKRIALWLRHFIWQHDYIVKYQGRDSAYRINGPVTVHARASIRYTFAVD